MSLYQISLIALLGLLLKFYLPFLFRDEAGGKFIGAGDGPCLTIFVEFLAFSRQFVPVKKIERNHEKKYARISGQYPDSPSVVPKHAERHGKLTQKTALGKRFSPPQPEKAPEYRRIAQEPDDFSHTEEKGLLPPAHAFLLNVMPNSMQNWRR